MHAAQGSERTMRKVLGGIATLITIAAMALVSSTAPAAADFAAEPDKPAGNGPGTVVQTGPVVVMTWQMPDRYSIVPKTFDQVNPLTWRVDIDTCKSYSAKGRVTSIRWKLFDQAGKQLMDTVTCKRSATIPALGKYRVQTTVTAADGTTTVSQWIEPKDHLIVVAGDSMASGEGNPDVAGNGHFEFCGQTIDPGNVDAEMGLGPSCIYDVIKLLSGDLSGAVEGTPATWKLDPDCHRSYNSGLSKAARDIETRDPHSSVTFINTACSGAETHHMYDTDYDGVYTSGPWDSGAKRPQAEQIAALVCGDVGTCDRARVRPIDGLFLSIGINDLHLSDILKDCMKPDFEHVLGVDGCHDSSKDEMNGYLGDLSAGAPVGAGTGSAMDAINRRFSDLGLPIRSIYQTLYPTDVFTSTLTGCGVFRFINPMEMAWLQDVNLALNQAVRFAHSNEYDWHAVWRDPMADPWPGHGYCTGSNRNFVSLFDSLAKYDGLASKIVNGAVHPNAGGQQVLRREFLNEYDQRNRPVTDRVVVTIEGAQVKSVQNSTHGWLLMGAGREGTDGAVRFGTLRALEVPNDVDFRPGEWVDLRSRNIRLSLGLNDAERLRLTLNSASTMPPREARCPHPDSDSTIYRAARQNGSGDGSGDVPCIQPVVRGFQIAEYLTDAENWGIGVSRTATDTTGNLVVRYHVSRQTCAACPTLDPAPDVMSKS